MGCRGDPSEATFGEQAALQNHWFYRINGNIWALEGVSGDLAGAKVAVKAGVDEVNGDSGARNKPKRNEEKPNRRRSDPSSPRKPFHS